MNHKAPYEQLIAEKLETIPIPDMADQIWARIEAQLDWDLPEDDTGPDLPDGPTGGSMGRQALLFITIVAIMSLFTIPKKNIPATVPLTTEIIAPSFSNEANAQPPPARQDPGIPAPRRNGPAGGSQRQAPDSTFTSLGRPPAETTLAGNAWVQQPITQPVTTPLLQDTLPRKKPRGVTGIGDNDYRIVPKKDSTNQ